LGRGGGKGKEGRGGERWIDKEKEGQSESESVREQDNREREGGREREREKERESARARESETERDRARMRRLVTRGADSAAPACVFSARSPAAAHTTSVAKRPHSSVGGIRENPVAPALAAFTVAANAGAADKHTNTAAKYGSA